MYFECIEQIKTLNFQPKYQTFENIPLSYKVILSKVVRFITTEPSAVKYSQSIQKGNPSFLKD